MNVYVVYDFVSGAYAVFDNEKDLNNFITKEKITWLKVVGQDYLEEEDYRIISCQVNGDWNL